MFAIVLLSIVAVCAAQVPTPCTSPKQWEGRRFREDRKQSYAQIARHTYDETNRRTRSIEEVFQGKERSFYDVLHLYNENKEYRMDLRTKKCNVTTLTRPFRPVGVPPSSRFAFVAEVGPSQIPGEHITAQGWDGTFEDGAVYFVTVTDPDCIPISFEVFNNKTDEFFHERYFDVKGGITDPSVFIPPSECMGL